MGTLEGSLKRWALKDFSKWRWGSEGGKNSWQGAGRGNSPCKGLEARDWSPFNYSYCSFTFAFNPHSNSMRLGVLLPFHRTGNLAQRG